MQFHDFAGDTGLEGTVVVCDILVDALRDSVAEGLDGCSTLEIRKRRFASNEGYTSKY